MEKQILDTNEVSFLWSEIRSSIDHHDKSVENSKEILQLPPYIPPDNLMNALIYAIERKAWPRARKLARELRFYDLERTSYLELEFRLNQILNLINRRLYPRSFSRRSTISSMTDSNSSTPRRSASKS